ncbi:MAG: hypothetical protein F4114_15880 [Rhodospirillaceae bacterium]|nr:hypothetical protein [Rhodospirillaceae bacterium]MYB13637.1 hypothetical protein [Rhodospirillaceae bacterium]MYI50551.1 hypothetical protein [Rhodospirillaceae bacterium]
MTEHSEQFAGNDTAAEPAGSGGSAAPGAPDGSAVAAPAKFLDPETGELRVDALMKSYMALEKRFGAGEHLKPGGAREDADRGDPGDGSAGRPHGADSGDPPAGPDPDDAADPDEADGPLDDSAADDTVPDGPDGYRIEADHPWLGNDAELNGVLHEHGFTQGQAQLVYDIAHEYVLPLLDRMAGEIAGLRGERQLRAVFPGDDWEARAEQTRQWGASALPEDLYQTLAATPAGVAAMHRMMQHGEPDFLSRTGPAGPAADEAELRRLMDDPRYWRDHDPATIAKVRDGFDRLYPG